MPEGFGWHLVNTKPKQKEEQFFYRSSSLLSLFIKDNSFIFHRLFVYMHSIHLPLILFCFVYFELK